MTTDDLSAGMMTATDRYVNGGSAARFLVAYYARFALGLLTTAAGR